MAVHAGKTTGAAVILLALVLCFAACVNYAPGRDANVTPAPAASAEPEASEHPTEEPSPEPVNTQEPTPLPTAEPTPDPASGVDALGNTITGPGHFKRYVYFENVIVYDEEGDTFVDAIAVNRYPVTITCAVDIVYYDADGAEIARARLRMRDGSYLLTLVPGDNYVLANILTDMDLSSREFVMEFDKDTPVLPVTENGDE